MKADCITVCKVQINRCIFYYWQNRAIKMKADCITVCKVQINRCIFYYWQNMTIKTLNLQWELMSRIVLRKSKEIKKLIDWLIDGVLRPSSSISTIIQYLDKFSADCITVCKVQINRCIFYHWQNRAIKTLNLHWKPMSITVLRKGKEIEKMIDWLIDGVLRPSSNISTIIQYLDKFSADCLQSANKQMYFFTIDKIGR